MKVLPVGSRTCIFCGGAPLSREHLYAKWMKPWLDAEGAPYGTEHVVTHYGQVPDMPPKVFAGPLTAPGDHRSRGLDVVCEACNNGWMSRLQNEAKPWLVPLLEGRTSQLTRDGQQAIAAWATMLAMVHEFADLKAVCVPGAERLRFFREKAPASGWLVWIARFTGKRMNGSMWHRALRLGSEDALGQAVPDHDKLMFTLGAVGHLLHVTVFVPDPIVFAAIRPHLVQQLHRFGLRRVHPRTSIAPSLEAYDDQTFVYLFETVTLLIGSALRRSPPL